MVHNNLDNEDDIEECKDAAEVERTDTPLGQSDLADSGTLIHRISDR